MYNLETRRYVRTYKADVRENIPLPLLITRSALDVELITGASNGEVRVYCGTSVDGSVQILYHDSEYAQLSSRRQTDVVM